MALKDKILDRAQKYMLKGYLDKALAEYRSAVPAALSLTRLPLIKTLKMP